MAAQGPRGASKSSRHFVLVRVPVEDEADHRMCFCRSISDRPRRHGQPRHHDYAHTPCPPQGTAPIDRDRGRGRGVGQGQGQLRGCMGHGTMLHHGPKKRTGYRERLPSLTKPIHRRGMASIVQKSGQLIVNTSHAYVRCIPSGASGHVRRSGICDGFPCPRILAREFKAGPIASSGTSSAPATAQFPK